jgi:hypothetical protein
MFKYKQSNPRMIVPVSIAFPFPKKNLFDPASGSRHALSSNYRNRSISNECKQANAGAVARWLTTVQA